MNLLKAIIASKEAEVASHRSLCPESRLTSCSFFRRGTLSLKSALLEPGSSGIVAEIKRKSPSKGILDDNAVAADLASGYFRAGAAGISVLTDHDFFGGSLDDLKAARERASCPLLRKDFIIDEYQMLEAKAAGADAVLLIAAVNPPSRNLALCRCAQQLGLEVLLELHTPEEIDAELIAAADLIGINNRDLRDFSVDIGRCLDLSRRLPEDAVKIAESGIASSAAIRLLKQAGFKGFLLGEFFMKSPSPPEACARLIAELEGAA